MQMVPLTAQDIATAWPYLDLPAQISDWLAREGYPGGHLPLHWWASDDIDQECYLLTGGGASVGITRRDVPAAEIDDGKIAAVHGQILARMYSGRYQSWTSDHRHGHPVTVRLPTGQTQAVSWIAIQCSDILPVGGSAHGVGS